MDVFTEKEIVDCLKSMAVSLRNLDRKLDDIAVSLREIASSEGEDNKDDLNSRDDEPEISG